LVYTLKAVQHCTGNELYSTRETETMPTYDYHCPANGRTASVWHNVSRKLTTWAELCQETGESLGDTPADAAIERLITGGGVITRNSPPAPRMPCGKSACGCAHG
jgi:predicted nucleic acid-binding Zn ribbon protein